MSSTIVGGLAPLIISYLVSFDLIYAGIYIAMSGFTLLLSHWLYKTGAL
ncbi:hypothetical protein [Yersinia artesiana]|nr:hypothetical protein [Yersinia artesiana]